MTRWYTLSETEDSFLQSAAIRTTKTLDVGVSAEELWEVLTADDAIVSWSPAVTKVEWKTPRPFGIGTVREVTIGGGAVTVKEQFYRWDEGKRKTFFVAESTRPGIRRMAEDYIVQSTPNGARLIWTVALEPAKFAKLASVVGGPVLSLTIGQLVRGLKRRIRREG